MSAWSATAMKPMLCHPGKHRHVARLLYLAIDGPDVWRCECTKCGHKWEEAA